jgi:hypothetical protein
MQVFIKAALITSALTVTTGLMAQQEKGFKLLFDGKTTQGWHTYNKTGIGAAWKVEDGTLHFDPAARVQEQGKWTGGGDIVTNEEFENFHLKLEWKVAPGGNSGIMFYVKEDPSLPFSFHSGPEMQVLDNAAHPDAKIFKHRAGDLYDLIPCSKEMVKPAGEWNLAEIIANKGSIELRLNGETVVQTSYGDDAWKKLVAGSKFKSMPAFGTFTKGRICLQDHGDKVWYRHIMIKSL